MVLGMEVDLNPGDFVLDWDPVPSPQKGGEAPSQFSANFYCGQTARCIKMPLGMEIGLSPGDFVLDGDPAPVPKKGQFWSGAPNLRPVVYFGQTAGWIKKALSMEVGLGPGHIVLDGDPAPRPQKGAEPPNFRPIFIVA